MTSVDRWQRDLFEAGALSASIVDRIARIHGDRGLRAIQAVSERRVKEYRDFTVVVGHKDEYIVEEGHCHCEDSEYNMDADDPADLCWHALSVEIASRIDAVDHHDMWYSDVREFL